MIYPISFPQDKIASYGDAHISLFSKTAEQSGTAFDVMICENPDGMDQIFSYTTKTLSHPLPAMPAINGKPSPVAEQTTCWELHETTSAVIIAADNPLTGTKDGFFVLHGTAICFGTSVTPHKHIILEQYDENALSRVNLYDSKTYQLLSESRYDPEYGLIHLTTYYAEPSKNIEKGQRRPEIVITSETDDHRQRGLATYQRFLKNSKLAEEGYAIQDGSGNWLPHGPAKSYRHNQDGTIKTTEKFYLAGNALTKAESAEFKVMGDNFFHLFNQKVTADAMQVIEDIMKDPMKVLTDFFNAVPKPTDHKL